MPYRNLISPRPLAILGLAALFAVLAALSVGLDRVHAQATTPAVTSVAIVSDPGDDNVYVTGNLIQVSVTFSEAVTVTGSPYIALEFDDGLRNVPYLGPTADGDLLFNYFVTPRGRIEHGVTVVENSLSLNGGSIRSQDDSTDADLSHRRVTEPHHHVNNLSIVFSNIEQAAASDAITVTADSSASVSFRVPVYTAEAKASGRNGRFVQQITLDIVTPSDTLDLTIRMANADHPNESYTFTGSASTMGRQVFAHQPAGGTGGPVALIRPWRTYNLTISGSGAGSAQIGATTSGGVDASGAGNWLVDGPPTQATIPRLRFRAFETLTPYIHHAGVISSPADGTTYRAGEQIEVHFILQGSEVGSAPAVAELWLGTGREHRREASLVTQIVPFESGQHLFYAYTVQSGDLDADGIMIGENPLGLNADGSFGQARGTMRPANLLLPAVQLGTEQQVNGAEEYECQAVLCGNLVADQTERLLGPLLAETIRSGFSLYHHGQVFPHSLFGESSRHTFRYDGISYALMSLARDEEFVQSTDTRLGDYLLADISPDTSEIVNDRLALVLDDAAGTTYALGEGGPLRTDGPDYYVWTAPGLRWAQDEVRSFQIIELPVTVTFAAGSYAMQEGESFDVRVNLGASFETKRVVLPLVVTAFGGATVDDYSGIPEQLEFAPGETEKTFTATLTQDDVDDDDEGLTLSFGAVPDAIKEGGDHEMATIVIRDDDHPELDVNFEQDSYSVPEGNAQTVNVTLSADPERTVAIPITVTPQGGADGTDYSDVPTSLTFNAGQTVRTITFVTTQDGVDDDDESVRLAFGSPLPERVSIGSVGETTFHIVDDDDPPVEISFEQGSYTIPEGGTQTVRVTLDADPEREVTVLITVTHQDGATGADYSGVPESLVFGPVETEKTFDFSAAQDDGDDDDESVRLTFGNLPPRVSRGSHGETTLHIGDDDDPVVTVQFEHAEYGVFEGGDVTLAVVLSADPERTVTIPLTRTNEGGATDSDYSGVPASVTFNSGETRQTFVFAALEDTDQEDGESVRLGFGTRPDRVDPGANDETTVTIQDCEGGGIWCGTLLFEKRDGRPSDDLYASLTTPDEFEYNDTRYRVVARWLDRALGTHLNTGLPFRIPERSSFRLALDDVNGRGLARVEIPDDHLDWTLHFGDVELPFSDAKFCCDNLFRWYGIEFTDIFDAWQPGDEHQLRITRTPLADRIPTALDPPLHVRVKPRNRGELSVSWVSPQLRNDGPPENATYKVQWKEISGSWDTPADVSEAVLAPGKPELWLFYTIRGLTPGVQYHVRVIAVNGTGDSAPSNVATGRTKPNPDQAQAQQAEPEPNNPAAGAPGISGTLAVGETLTATTSGISDEDGLENAVFAYQWVRHDPADPTGADIPGETARTYTVTSDDDGKGLRVRVTFTDDAGNRESLTSNAYLTAPPVQDPSGASDEPAANSPATGAPTINGTVQVGRTLTAETSDISDPDGMDDAAFAYQWVAGGNDVSGATAASHTLTADQEGLPITVRVSFTDDVGNPEALTSAATEAVTAPPPLTAEFLSAPASHDGQTAFTFELRFSEEFDISYTTLRDHAFTVTGGEVTGVRRLEPPGNVRWEITVTPDTEAAVTVELPPTTDCDNQGAVCTDDGRMLSDETALTVPGPVEEDEQAREEQESQEPENSPATGAPTIAGTARVGETLTADVSSIADADGLTDAVFGYQWLADGAEIAGAANSTYTLAADDEGRAVSVQLSFSDDAGNEETLTSEPTAEVAAKPNSTATGQLTISGTAQVGETLTANTSSIADADGLDNATFTYQWLAGDAEIAGATGASYTLVGADVGKTIKVRVSFTDDAGHGETLTSAATNPVAGLPPELLTARFENQPSSHDGENVFTFELRFSEQFHLSYKTLRDHAFTVTGGTVKKAKRTEQGSNIHWRITVRPDGNGNVTITLPVTTDCDAQGAICTGDGRMLSNRLEITVPGPGG